jgi:uncharacterized membrane protein
VVFRITRKFGLMARHAPSSTVAACLAAAMVCLGMLAPAPAHAKLRLCNETSYVLSVATAFQLGLASKTEGWQSVLPGACKTALKNIPDGAGAFVHAVSHPAHSADKLVFDGSERFCIGPRERRFTIEGRRECRKRGHVSANFAPVEMDATRPTVTFTEDDNFGRLAVMAGIQRLLGDIGYETGTIDGFGGVRTREAISAFKLRYQIRGNPSNSDLLARLLDTAAEQSEERGLIMCNKTDYLVWAATGIVREDSFESRGWHRIDAKDCEQVINGNLDDKYYFYYAEAVTDTGRQAVRAGRPVLWQGDFTMCTKSTRFVINNREDCQARGLDAAKFRRIDTGTARKWRVNLD